jgi:hypothetical protein
MGKLNRSWLNDDALGVEIDYLYYLGLQLRIPGSFVAILFFYDDLQFLFTFPPLPFLAWGGGGGGVRT